MKEINKRLAELRKQRKLTQEEMANKLNINLSTYKTYETRNTPKLEMLVKLADFYDLSLDFLLSRPHPHDLPMVATEEQKSVIATVLQLNEANTMKAHSYCLGLLANQ